MDKKLQKVTERNNHEIINKDGGELRWQHYTLERLI